MIWKSFFFFFLIICPDLAFILESVVIWECFLNGVIWESFINRLLFVLFFQTCHESGIYNLQSRERKGLRKKEGREGRKIG